MTEDERLFELYKAVLACNASLYADIDSLGSEDYFRRYYDWAERALFFFCNERGKRQ